jgi:hypothetical protein
MDVIPLLSKPAQARPADTNRRWGSARARYSATARRPQVPAVRLWPIGAICNIIIAMDPAQPPDAPALLSARIELAHDHHAA